MLLSYIVVALFMRAWIEISLFENKASWNNVALFMRAWIEIKCKQ